VCIAAADGADSRGVARLVAEGLGFRLVDDAVVVDAAQAEGLLPEVVAHAETRESGRTIEVDFGRVERTEALREAIRAAVARAADEGSIVIHAHAASYALAGREGVLRVFLTAPAETRAARLADGEGLDAKAAAKRLTESDRGRSAYLERFYGVKGERPTDYDLVLNMERLGAEEAAAIVVRAAAGQ
jgi:cytidylate kinase